MKQTHSNNRATDEVAAIKKAIEKLTKAINKFDTNTVQPGNANWPQVGTLSSVSAHLDELAQTMHLMANK